MSRALVLVLVAAASLGACYRESHDAEILQRLTKIEQRLDAQDKALKDSRKRPDTTELALLAQQLSDLEHQVKDLSDRAKVSAAPPLTPSATKRRRPDPAVTYAVPVGTSAVFGSPKAKVTIVMAFEFACPYCRKAWDTIDDLRRKYGNDLRVVYKQLVVHPSTATIMANASCAAQRQNRWRELAELLWDKAFATRQYDQANIDALAVEAGLDVRHYQSDMAGSCPQEIKDDIAMLNKLGVSATPSFFVNGRFMEGARPPSEFEALINEELAKATAAVKRGVKPERYYDQEIVGKGVTELPAP